jgi:hypothetical protein
LWDRKVEQTMVSRLSGEATPKMAGDSENGEAIAEAIWSPERERTDSSK